MPKKIIRAVIALTNGQASLDSGETLPAPEGTRVGARVVLVKDGLSKRLERLWDVAPDRIRDPPGTVLEAGDGPPELLDSPKYAEALNGKFCYACPALTAPLERREFGDTTVEGHALTDGRFLAARAFRKGQPLSRREAYGFFKDRRLKFVPIAWEKWRYDSVRETPERLRQYAIGAVKASAEVLQVVGMRVALESDPSTFFDIYP